MSYWTNDHFIETSNFEPKIDSITKGDITVKLLDTDLQKLSLTLSWQNWTKLIQLINSFMQVKI